MFAARCNSSWWTVVCAYDASQARTTYNESQPSQPTWNNLFIAFHSTALLESPHLDALLSPTLALRLIPPSLDRICSRQERIEFTRLFSVHSPQLPTRVHVLDAYLPFPYGPRNCIGQALATTELQSVPCRRHSGWCESDHIHGSHHLASEVRHCRCLRLPQRLNLTLKASVSSEVKVVRHGELLCYIGISSVLLTQGEESHVAKSF